MADAVLGEDGGCFVTGKDSISIRLEKAHSPTASRFGVLYDLNHRLVIVCLVL